MKYFKSLSLVPVALLVFLLASCDKTKPYETVTPPPQAHFVGAKFQAYSAAVAPVPVFNVIVGSTDVSNVDRQVTYKVASSSGATGGTQYTIATGNTTGTVTIKAGEARANIPVQAIFNAYTAGRRDTLMFTLQEPSMAPSKFMDTVYVTIRGACFEGDVNLNEFLGTYANTNELLGTSAYGPYTTTISSVSQVTATTGKVTVENIWDNGWAPITFDLDWTNPANRITSLIQQDNIADGSTVNPQYAGSSVTVTNPSATSFPNQRGTFSICNQTLQFKMRICLLPLGCFSSTLYTVNLAR
jgi:hypothetical protein